MTSCYNRIYDCFAQVYCISFYCNRKVAKFRNLIDFVLYTFRALQGRKMHLIVLFRVFWFCVNSQTVVLTQAADVTRRWRHSGVTSSRRAIRASNERSRFHAISLKQTNSIKVTSKRITHNDDKRLTSSLIFLDSITHHQQLQLSLFSHYLILERISLFHIISLALL